MSGNRTAFAQWIVHTAGRGGARLTAIVLSSVLMTACATKYYRTLETFGIEKRDTLVGRPVLSFFNDQALALRNNLNARATGSLESELIPIECAPADLITQMQLAIAEVSRFIAQVR